MGSVGAVGTGVESVSGGACGLGGEQQVTVGREVGEERSAERRAAERPKPHDLQNLVTSGYLERLGFDYKPATAATMFRQPSIVTQRP